MDRRQTVALRAREWFGDRLEDLELLVRQARQEVRGWEEPAHLRAVLRRPLGGRNGPATINERAGVITSAPTDAPELELARGAGEPERGPQREATGRLLEAGA